MSRYLLRDGDVLFNNTNSEKLVGKTAFWDADGDFVLSNHMTILRVNSSQPSLGLDAFFLSRCLFKKWLDGHFRSLCRRHVNQASVSLARLKQVPIPLPPLPEQRRIAHVLNTIQRAIAAQDALVAAARQLKRSLMHRLFTYGPGRDPAPTKETEIGEIPEHWEVTGLGEVVDIVAGGTPSRKRLEYWNGGIPWVKTGEVNYNSITQTEENISRAGLGHSSARLIPAGTLLMAMYGQGITRGKVAILGIRAAINQACAAMFVSEGIETEFLFFYLTSNYERIRNLGHGAHQKNLSATLLKSALIAIPPISEQIQIARLLASTDRKIAAEEQRRAAHEALFRSMLHQLMTGQMRAKEVEP